jgi:hypothetical protein
LLGHLSIKESRCARRVGAFDQSGKLGTTEYGYLPNARSVAA